MGGRIPKQFIDEVLLRADIVDLIDAYVPLKKAGKDYKACCPFHEEKTASFTVSPIKQFYHCFGCGAHGTAIGFLMEYEHMSFPEAVAELARRAGLPMPQESAEPGTRADVAAPLLEVLAGAARFYAEQLRRNPRAIDYLKGRGISGEIAAAFGLGYAPDGWDHLLRRLGSTSAGREALIQAGLAIRKDGGGTYDRFRDRIMFPIHDYRGRIIGFGGRILDKGEPKYLNSPETALFHKGRELYGLYRAREAIRQAGQVVVVEGYMDVVGLAQAGIDIAVAALGTASTRDHLERLFRFVPEGQVVFCFDGDRAGQEAAWRALDTVLPALHERRRVSFMFLPEGEDPDSLVRSRGKEAFLAEVRAARSVPDFLYQGLARKVDLGRSDGAVRLAELARPYLDKVPAGLLREAMLDRLRLTPALHQQLASPRAGGGSRSAAAVGPRQAAPLMRLAIALLVQHPGLAAHAQSREFLGDLDSPGVPLLRSLLDLLQENPQLNTAALVEHFRESEHGLHVARLAAWEHPALAADVSAEFTGVLIQLKRTAIKRKVENLLQKQKISGLTREEIEELARLTGRAREKPETAPT